MTGEELKSWANQRADFEATRLNLKEKISEELCVVYNGGLFKATMELITFLTIMHEEELIIEDTFSNPVKINRLELVEKLNQAFKAAMNSWHYEFQKIRKVRKGKDF